MNNIKKKLNKVGNSTYALGKATLKHPITTALSLCMLIGITANLVSYSQTTKPTVTQEKVTGTMLNWENLVATEKANKFPMRDIEITDTKGKTIKGDILSTTRTHIVFLMEEKEYKIKWRKLSKKTIAKIKKERKLTPKKSVTEKEIKLPTVTLDDPEYITLSLEKQAKLLPLHDFQIIGTDNNAITGDILDIVDENGKTTEPFDATNQGYPSYKPKKQNLTYHHIIFQKDGKKYKINWSQLSQKTTDAIKTARTFSRKEVEVMTKHQIKVQKKLPELRQKLVETKNRKTKNKTEEKIKKLEIEALSLFIKHKEKDISTPEDLLYKEIMEIKKIPKEEIFKKMRDPNDPIHALKSNRYYHLSKKISGLKKDPNWESYNKTMMDIYPTLKIAIPIKKDKGYTMETKLFDEIKYIYENDGKGVPWYEYGVYLKYQLLQTVCKQKGITCPKINAPKNVDMKDTSMRALYPNMKINTQFYENPSSFEFVKQQLRKNIPIIIYGAKKLKKPIKVKKYDGTYRKTCFPRYDGIAVGYHYDKNKELIIHWLDPKQPGKKEIKQSPAKEISPGISITIH